MDKRGIGASRAAGPREEDLRFNSYVADAIAWVDMLRAQPRVRSVTVLGHSEGALVATLTAQQTEVEGLILIAGVGYPASVVIARQLATVGTSVLLRDTAERIIASLQRGELVREVPAELTPLFHPSVQPYVMSWLQIDPAAELAQVKARILIVQGTVDLQVSIEDARRLKAVARPDASFVLIPSMNHVLKLAPPIERRT